MGKMGKDYLSKGRQIQSIRKIARNGTIESFDIEQIDFESFVDSETSYKATRRNFLEKYGKFLTEEYKEKYGVYNVSKEEVMEKNRKRLKEFQKEQVNKITENQIPEVKEHYKDLIDYTKMLVRANWEGLIIKGRGGVGKTHQIFNTLKEEGLEMGNDFHYFKGYTTPLELYKALYEHSQAKVIILDDLEGIFKSDRGKAILKASLDKSMGERIVTYQSSSHLMEDVPSRFRLKARIIALANTIPDDVDFRALKDRVLFLEKEFSYEEMIEVMRQLIKKEYKGLSLEERKEILKVLTELTSPATINLSIRTLFKAYEMYRYNKGIWKRLVQRQLVNSKELEFIYEKLQEFDKVKKARKKYQDEYDKSRRTFFRKKKKLLL